MVKMKHVNPSVRRDRSGDDAPCGSLREVYTRHVGWMKAVLLARLMGNSSAADDILQQVFLRLHRRIRLRGSVPHPIVPVLNGILRDQIRNHVRDEKRRRDDAAPDSQIPASKPDPEQLLSRAEREREAEAILAEMDERQVMLLELHHGRDLLVKDIAAVLGKAAGAVKVELYRARARFKELYLRNQGSRRKP